jgi:hypothetical protein
MALGLVQMDEFIRPFLILSTSQEAIQEIISLRLYSGWESGMEYFTRSLRLLGIMHQITIPSADTYTQDSFVSTILIWRKTRFVALV